MFCTFCGKGIDDDSRFCVYCGGKFDKVIEVKSPEKSNTRRSICNESLYQASICPCCGAPIKGNVTQCEYCETPMIKKERGQNRTTINVVAQPVQIVTSQAMSKSEINSIQSNQNKQPYNVNDENTKKQNNQQNDSITTPQNSEESLLDDLRLLGKEIKSFGETFKSLWKNS